MLINSLQAEVEQLRAELGDWPDGCRCSRALVCSGCNKLAGECDCSDIFEEEMEDDDDPGTDDPLARTLMGLPSGIHCHTNGCHDA